GRFPSPRSTVLTRPELGGRSAGLISLRMSNTAARGRWLPVRGGSSAAPSHRDGYFRSRRAETSPMTRNWLAGGGTWAAPRQGPRLRFVVDGKPVASSAAFEPADYDLSCDQPVRIGFGPIDYFHGSLRDLRVYNRALTNEEVARLAGAE